MSSALPVVRPSHHRRVEVYAPAVRPGFTAWVTAFEYGDGSIGVSFKETTQAGNPTYERPTLEMGEAAGSPVSYGAIDFASPLLVSERVYLRTTDGERYIETGRCPIEEGAFTNIGFPDGRIIGLEVRRVNDARTGWCDEIDVRESTDGGSTWTVLPPLLAGTSCYVWRVRRLRDGTIVVLASLYGTPWGVDRERTTRNTMFPGETYLSKIQTFFLTSSDGRTYSGPHYVLPGIGAHEYDMVERPDGSLLFIAGDVQATPVARQVVERRDGAWINGSMLAIALGAPADPSANPQGGWVPETVVARADGLLVGARRNKPYSVSNDDGRNWLPVEGMPPSLYQPFLITMPDGTLANFGHVGSDSPFGHQDMTIGVDLFDIENTLLPSPRLTLRRLLDDAGDQYLNRFAARLTVGGEPLAGAELTFRFVEVWNPDGSFTTCPQSEAPYQLTAVTDRDGTAVVHAAAFDGRGDINLYYNADVVYRPSTGIPVDGPMMVTIALTPRRGDDQPHEAYFMEGTLYIADRLEADHPGLIALLGATAPQDDPGLDVPGLPPGALARLAAAGVVEQADGAWRWISSVHAPHTLAAVRPMPHDDQYV
ncbi:hypothetical protein PROP_02891 [Propionicimonas sp. T2.31MG-18]|uniref:hypothetical protein n=1 Tax=Propionicimonas sp. T2.31MG-18 TaxID=3157620 RepID=UPI0035E7ED89